MTGAMVRLINISGGKGGVGKSLLSANLAFWAAKLIPHKDIVLISGDPTNKTVDRFVERPARYGWDDFLKDEMLTLEECLSTTKVRNLYIVMSTRDSLIDIDEDLKRVAEKLRLFKREVQYSSRTALVIMDSPAGFWGITFVYTYVFDENILVTTPMEDDVDGTAEFVRMVREGWLKTWGEEPDIRGVVVNKTYTLEEAREVSAKLGLPLLASIPYTENKEVATREKRILSEMFPSDPASVALKEFTERLLGIHDEGEFKRAPGLITQVVESLLGLLSRRGFS